MSSVFGLHSWGLGALPVRSISFPRASRGLCLLAAGLRRNPTHLNKAVSKCQRLASARVNNFTSSPHFERTRVGDRGARASPLQSSRFSASTKASDECSKEPDSRSPLPPATREGQSAALLTSGAPSRRSLSLYRGERSRANGRSLNNTRTQIYLLVQF